MRVKHLALIVSALCSTGVMAAKNNVSLEDKLAQLEARLESAESRATNAEAQIQALQQQQTPRLTACRPSPSSQLSRFHPQRYLSSRFLVSVILNFMAMSNLIWMRPVKQGR